MAEREPKLLLPDRDREEFAMHLHAEGLIGINESPDDYIKLKSGRMSPHYFNVRPGISSYGTRMLIAGTMARLSLFKTDAPDYPSLTEHYDYFVGSPEAMTSYGASIADIAEMGVLQPRVNTAKVTGNKTPILGKFTEGERVAAFDDVITDGATKIETIGSLDSLGLSVEDYYVVLDREEGGAGDVEAATGMVVTPALGLANTVRILRTNGAITQTQFDNVAEYMAEYGDPHAVAELAA